MHVGDDPGNVIRNRELLQNQISKKVEVPTNSKWLFLNQTHENNIVALSKSYVIDNNNPPQADASVTNLKDQPLVCMTADCGPLVLYTNDAVAVVHASWRTIASEIIESTMEELLYISKSAQIKGMLGPCIHPQNYEFDEFLLDEIATKLGQHIKGETMDSKPAFDLPGSVRHILKTNNVEFEDLNIDTYTSANHYSFRRDGSTGRQAVIAWLK